MTHYKDAVAARIQADYEVLEGRLVRHWRTISREKLIKRFKKARIDPQPTLDALDAGGTVFPQLSDVYCVRPRLGDVGIALLTMQKFLADYLYLFTESLFPEMEDDYDDVVLAVENAIKQIREIDNE